MDEKIIWRSMQGNEKPLKEVPTKRLMLFYLGNKTPCFRHPAYRDISPEEWVPILEAEIRRRGKEPPESREFWDLDKESMV